MKNNKKPNGDEPLGFLTWRPAGNSGALIDKGKIQNFLVIHHCIHHPDAIRNFVDLSHVFMTFLRAGMAIRAGSHSVSERMFPMNRLLVEGLIGGNGGGR